jgi:hypothetical protein
MPLQLSIPITELQQLRSSTKLSQAGGLTFSKPTTPSNIVVTGLKFGFVIQWSKVSGVTGYQIAVMSGNNLAAPNLLLSEMGEDSMERPYFVGDVALTRSFAVRAFIQSTTGFLFSKFTEIKSGTSKVDGGVSDGTPADPPAPPPDPGESPEEPCLVEGSLVKTPNGYIPVETAGKFLITHIGTCESIMVNVPIEAKCYKVLIQSKPEFECSYSHPLQVLGRGWTRVENLFTDDKVNTEDGFLPIISIEPTGKRIVRHLKLDGPINSYQSLGGVYSHNSIAK